MTWIFKTTKKRQYKENSLTQVKEAWKNKRSLRCLFHHTNDVFAPAMWRTLALRVNDW